MLKTLKQQIFAHKVYLCHVMQYQKDFVSLHADNMFVQPAYESSLIALDRAVSLAKNS